MALVCTQVIGNIAHFVSGERVLDSINMEWFDAYKRIGRYESTMGKDCIIKFDKLLINGLCDGDIIYVDSHCIVSIAIQPSACLQIKTQGLLEVAKLCYEIGNFHIPLFLFDNGDFYIPYERTIHRILQRLGFCVIECEAKLNARYRLHTLNNEVALNAMNGDNANLLQSVKKNVNLDKTSLVQISSDFNISFSKKQK